MDAVLQKCSLPQMHSLWNGILTPEYYGIPSSGFVLPKKLSLAPGPPEFYKKFRIEPLTSTTELQKVFKVN